MYKTRVRTSKNVRKESISQKVMAAAKNLNAKIVYLNDGVLVKKNNVTYRESSVGAAYIRLFAMAVEENR